MTDAWHSVKIKHVELVRVGSTTALLRVDGTAPRRRGIGDRRPALIVSTAAAPEQRFEALQAPPDGRGVLRAAYSLPAAQLAGESTLVLRLADGFEVPLPAPAQGAALPTPPQSAASQAVAA
ncbi:MAG: hypothetical protein ACRDL5_08175, partial [Solirubrobacteraceae bacterium]